jgi:hypothetical protein
VIVKQLVRSVVGAVAAFVYSLAAYGVVAIIAMYNSVVVDGAI